MYNSWGEVISLTGPAASTIGTLNPFRYRGYVYDEETRLYYLQSRYYDPELCRFISSDVLLSTGQGVIGHNAYAYCGNNPVSRADDEGQFWNIVIGAAVGAIVSGVTTAVDSYSATGKVDWGKVAISSAVGAVSGGVAATGLGVFAQAAITATASALGSIATDIYSTTQKKSIKEITVKEAGGMALRAAGSAAIGFGSSVFGSAAGKIVTNGIEKEGASMIFRGKVGAGCYSKSSARHLVNGGKKLVDTAYGISSVVGTLFTWPVSTALTYGP